MLDALTASERAAPASPEAVRVLNPWETVANPPLPTCPERKTFLNLSRRALTFSWAHCTKWRCPKCASVKRESEEAKVRFCFRSEQSEQSIWYAECPGYAVPSRQGGRDSEQTSFGQRVTRSKGAEGSYSIIDTAGTGFIFATANLKGRGRLAFRELSVEEATEKAVALVYGLDLDHVGSFCGRWRFNDSDKVEDDEPLRPVRLRGGADVDMDKAVFERLEKYFVESDGEEGFMARIGDREWLKSVFVPIWNEFLDDALAKRNAGGPTTSQATRLPNLVLLKSG